MDNLEILREVLAYCPTTGVFHWKTSPSKSVRSGDIAGTKHPDGYVVIGYKGRAYLAHRLAWFFMTGELPTTDIDHADGEGLNNRFSNLRLANEAENLWNRKLCTRNKSGVKGVCWYAAGQKWAAQIRKNGVKHFLGYFEDISVAEKVVREARNRLHGEFANHGGRA